MITDRIGLYSVLLPLLITSIGRSLRENLKPGPTVLSLGQYGKASVWDFPVTTSLSVIRSLIIDHLIDNRAEIDNRVLWHYLIPGKYRKPKFLNGKYRIFLSVQIDFSHHWKLQRKNAHTLYSISLKRDELNWMWYNTETLYSYHTLMRKNFDPVWSKLA